MKGTRGRTLLLQGYLTTMKDGHLPMALGLLARGWKVSKPNGKSLGSIFLHLHNGSSVMEAKKHVDSGHLSHEVSA